MNNSKNIKIKFVIKNIMEKKFFEKPFLKWTGGKTQIIVEVLNKFPREINNYHEIFLGGGSVLLAFLCCVENKKINVKGKVYVYDLNNSLINTFNQLKNNLDNLLKELEKIKTEFSSIKINTKGQRGAPKNINIDNYKETREHYYYWQREVFNKTDKNTLKNAVLFIFLNKTGFKGMFREGKKGFNIPYGLKDKNSIPSMYDEDNLSRINKLIKNVEFKNIDFRVSLGNVSKGDFVYLDPPYVPEQINSFVEYLEGGFDGKSHEELFEEIKKLHQKDIRFLMSNSNTNLVKEYFKDFKIEEIGVRRAINSKNPGSKTKELFVFNNLKKLNH
jgi:DNA adenine methylase